MATMTAEHDLLIIIDATSSMGSYLLALNSSVPEILALSTLSGSFQRVGILAYRDYSEPQSERIEWSGWDHPNLPEFARSIRPMGGGDYPEAGKTALVEALDKVDGSRKTLILWYADAPPHHPSNTSARYEQGSAFKEIKAYPNRSIDWVHLSYEAAKKKCTVFSIISGVMDMNDASFNIFLSQATRGLCITTPTSVGSWEASASDAAIQKISKLTLDVLLSWMGHPTPPREDKVQPDWYSSCSLRYRKPSGNPPKPTDELKGNQGYLPSESGQIKVPVDKVLLDLEIIPQWSVTGQLDPSKRFADPSETSYRASVYATLHKIIQTNIYSLSWNAIFGQLWRAVCKERDNPDRAALLNEFSNQVSKIDQKKKQEDMKQWLEDSYDSAGEIEAMIAEAPDAHLGAAQPRVFLDLDAQVKLTRIELLEVSRSCYAGVLEKLATIFTHAKMTDPSLTLTEHQRSIPLSLPAETLFRILPHLVVPGTLFSPRASALMANLALVVGVPFLIEPATKLLQKSQGKWLNKEVPENLSYECARFLLSGPKGVALNDEEVQLLELNVEATLLAKTPWTPSKTREVGDRKVPCEKCGIKRSVTMMSEDRKGYCGICAESGSMKPEDFQDKGEMQSCWVECYACKGQYVVENVAALNVRPKCWYCRNSRTSPYQQCVKCSNKIITPKHLQTIASDSYSCPPCELNSPSRKTIVEEETNCKALIAENQVTWLGLEPEPDLFSNKSAFKLFDAHGASFFNNVSSAIPIPSGTILLLNSKPILNSTDIRAQVDSRIGKGEVELGTCTLCFNDQPYHKLTPACGRSGCAHRVDDECLQRWYGLNEPGKILSLMQLRCPFCRRKPATKVLARYNARAAALGGVQAAIEDRHWIYGWCGDCGFAKRAVERVCCVGEAVPPIERFVCEQCEEARRVRAPFNVTTTGDQGTSVRITPCPNKDCGVMVEKTFGCNHITCACGTHFCHVCGKEFSMDSIYKHMADAHGGFMDHDNEDDYDSDYEMDD